MFQKTSNYNSNRNNSNEERKERRESGREEERDAFHHSLSQHASLGAYNVAGAQANMETHSGTVRTIVRQQGVA